MSLSFPWEASGHYVRWAVLWLATWWNPGSATTMAACGPAATSTLLAHRVAQTWIR